MGFFTNFLKNDNKNKMNSISYKERFNNTKLIVDINALKNFENPLNAEGKEKNSIDEIENGYRIGKFDVGCVRLDSLVKGKKFAKESEKEENSVLFFVRDRETGKVERFTCNHLENDDSLKFNSLKGRFEKEIDKNAFWIKSSINQEKEKNANNFYIRLADIRHHYAENNNIVIEKINFKEEFEKEHPKKEKMQENEKKNTENLKEEPKKHFEEKKETIKEKTNVDNEKIDRLKDLKSKKEYYDSEDKLNNAKKAQTLKEILNSNKKKKYADSEEKLYQNPQEKRKEKLELENDFSNYFDGKTKEELLKQKENLINYFNPQGKEIDDFKNYQEEIESISPKIKPLKNYIFEEIDEEKEKSIDTFIKIKMLYNLEFDKETLEKCNIVIKNDEELENLKKYSELQFTSQEIANKVLYSPEKYSPERLYSKLDEINNKILEMDKNFPENKENYIKLYDKILDGTDDIDFKFSEKSEEKIYENEAKNNEKEKTTNFNSDYIYELDIETGKVTKFTNDEFTEYLLNSEIEILKEAISESPESAKKVLDYIEDFYKTDEEKAGIFEKLNLDTPTQIYNFMLAIDGNVGEDIDINDAFVDDTTIELLKDSYSENHNFNDIEEIVISNANVSINLILKNTKIGTIFNETQGEENIRELLETAYRDRMGEVLAENKDYIMGKESKENEQSKQTENPNETPEYEEKGKEKDGLEL